MAFRGKKGRPKQQSRSGPQLPSVLRKQIAAQTAEDGSGGSARRETSGGKLNHRERRKFEKDEKGVNGQRGQQQRGRKNVSGGRAQKDDARRPEVSKKRRRAVDAPRTKFEELLSMEKKAGGGAAAADIELERRLAKKLKLKDGKIKGPQDGFDVLLGGLKDYGGQEEEEGTDEESASESGGSEGSDEGEFGGLFGEASESDGSEGEADFDLDSDEEEEGKGEVAKKRKQSGSKGGKKEEADERSDGLVGDGEGASDGGASSKNPDDDLDQDLDTDSDHDLDQEEESGSESPGDEDLGPSPSGREESAEEEPIETDIFGRPKQGGPEGSAAVKYVPPHLRAAAQGPLSEEMVRLQRRIRGLLNRLTEANVESIASEMVLIFQAHARHSVMESIKEEILGSLISGPRGNDQYAAVFAAFIAGLAASVGVEIGANFLGALVVSFEEQYKRRDSLACRNLALVLAHLYNFQLLASPFLYEFLHHLLARFHELDVATIAHLLQACGLALRSDDPVRMKDFVLAVQRRTAQETAALVPLEAPEKKAKPLGDLGEKAAESFRAAAERVTSAAGGVTSAKEGADPGLSKRVRFMLDTITDTKNNRRRGDGEAPWQGRLRKWLGKNNVDAAQLRSVTLANALTPHKKGLWWLPPAAGTLEKSAADSAHFGGVVSGAIDGGAAEADRLLQLASKQRMNTDVRRSIFCIIMSGEDYVDAHEKLLRLKLPGKQDREILRVLVDCCMQERCFNKYYALLAARLCSQEHNHKFTLQYCVWDHFKQLPSMDLRRSANLARFLAGVIASFALSLSILKAVEFTDPQMDAKTVMHFRILLETLLLDSPRDVVVSAFGRIAGQPQLSALREGISLFFHQHLLRHQPIVQSKDRSSDDQMGLLLKRIKAAKKAMSSVGGAAAEL